MFRLTKPCSASETNINWKLRRWDAKWMTYETCDIWFRKSYPYHTWDWTANIIIKLQFQYTECRKCFECSSNSANRLRLKFDFVDLQIAVIRQSLPNSNHTLHVICKLWRYNKLQTSDFWDQTCKMRNPAQAKFIMRNTKSQIFVV